MGKSTLNDWKVLIVPWWCRVSPIFFRVVSGDYGKPCIFFAIWRKTEEKHSKMFMETYINVELKLYFTNKNINNVMTIRIICIAGCNGYSNQNAKCFVVLVYLSWLCPEPKASQSHVGIELTIFSKGWSAWNNAPIKVWKKNSGRTREKMWATKRTSSYLHDTACLRGILIYIMVCSYPCITG